MTGTEEDDMRARWSIAQEVLSSHKNIDKSAAVSGTIRKAESEAVGTGSAGDRRAADVQPAGNSDLLDLKRSEGIRIVSRRAFLDLLVA